MHFSKRYDFFIDLICSSFILLFGHFCVIFSSCKHQSLDLHYLRVLSNDQIKSAQYLMGEYKSRYQHPGPGTKIREQILLI